MRQEYSLDEKYNFIDLKKLKNYIAFESGVVCFFPNYFPNWTEPKDYGCAENEWYYNTYINLKSDEKCTKDSDSDKILCQASYLNGTVEECENHLFTKMANCCHTEFVDGVLTENICFQ